MLALGSGQTRPAGVQDMRAPRQAIISGTLLIAALLTPLILIVATHTARQGARSSAGPPPPGKEPGPDLPPGATVLQEASGDTDGDGVADRVVLYSIPRGAGIDAGSIVLHGPRAARRSEQLFGSDPKPYAPSLGAPADRPTPQLKLDVRESPNDGRAEISLVNGIGDEWELWLFRWDGASYRLPANPWRTPYFGSSVRPEDAVVAYYQALDRGDLQAAYALLDDDEQAPQRLAAFAAGFNTTLSTRLEELRRYSPTRFGGVLVESTI